MFSQMPVKFPQRKRRRAEEGKGEENESLAKKSKQDTSTRATARRSSPRVGPYNYASSSSSSLLCREDQLLSLSSFLSTHLTKRKPGALYISGAPGTGKTACLSCVLDQSEDLVGDAHVIIFNCMNIKTPQAVYAKIAGNLPGFQGRLEARQVEPALIDCITSSEKMILVVLDEIDKLESHGQEVLYSLFEWPTLPNSKLVLIGIANTLELTRVLPRLKAHCQPKLLHFPPYTKDQIVTILWARVEGGEGVTVVDPMAIQFIAKKVASVYGDLRKALDICRRAIQIRASSSSSEQPVRVTVKDISAVMSSTLSRHTLPLQQQLVVCTLLVMVRGRGVKEVTVGKLMDTYMRMCREKKLKAESESEFIGICRMLEARGIVVIKKAREARAMKVALKLEESNVEHALQDSVLASILKT